MDLRLVFVDVTLILGNNMVLAHLPLQVLLILLNQLGLLDLLLISLLLQAFLPQCIDLILNNLGLSNIELILRLDIRVTVRLGQHAGAGLLHGLAVLFLVVLVAPL